MFPFRELEIYDAFLFDGRECEKVGERKYLVMDSSHEPETLETADPNLMVRLIEDKVKYEDDYLHWYFFSTLLSMLDAMESSGQRTLKISELKELAQFSLDLGNQENQGSENG